STVMSRGVPTDVHRQPLTLARATLALEGGTDAPRRDPRMGDGSPPRARLRARAGGIPQRQGRPADDLAAQEGGAQGVPRRSRAGSRPSGHLRSDTEPSPCVTALMVARIHPHTTSPLPVNSKPTRTCLSPTNPVARKARSYNASCRRYSGYAPSVALAP